MRGIGMLAAGLLALSGLWTGLAHAQDKPPCDRQAILAASPEKIEGEVVRVDRTRNRLSVRQGDGKTHEFEVSQETLQNLKVGDRIQAKRSALTNC